MPVCRSFTLYIFDERGRFTYASQALTDLLGIMPKEIVSKTFFDLSYPHNLAARLQRQIQQVLNTGETLTDTTAYTNPRSSTGFYEYIFTPVIIPHGRVELIVGLTRDMIERKRVENKVRKVDRCKDEFLATLAHELRNSLAPIRTGLELMRLAGEDRGLIEEVRATMEMQVRQLASLIDDLMDISRITRGKITLRRERVELAVVARAAVGAARSLIEAAGHELTVAFPPQPFYLETDPTRPG